MKKLLLIPIILIGSCAFSQEYYIQKVDTSGGVEVIRGVDISENSEIIRSKLNETFYLERVETIGESGSSPKEYFTYAQNGTEINNVIVATGGTYYMRVSFICSNSSKSGAVIVDPQLGGVGILSKHYEHEPSDSDIRFYVTYVKKITLAAGNNTLSLQLSNDHSGTGYIYEASILIIKL